MSQTSIVTVGYFLKLAMPLHGGLNDLQLHQRILGAEELLDQWFFPLPLNLMEAESWLHAVLPGSHKVLGPRLIDDLKKIVGAK